MDAGDACGAEDVCGPPPIGLMAAEDAAAACLPATQPPSSELCVENDEVCILFACERNPPDFTSLGTLKIRRRLMMGTYFCTIVVNVPQQFLCSTIKQCVIMSKKYTPCECITQKNTNCANGALHTKFISGEPYKVCTTHLRGICNPSEPVHRQNTGDMSPKEIVANCIKYASDGRTKDFRTCALRAKTICDKHGFTDCREFQLASEELQINDCTEAGDKGNHEAYLACRKTADELCSTPYHKSEPHCQRWKSISGYIPTSTSERKPTTSHGLQRTVEAERRAMAERAKSRAEELHREAQRFKTARARRSTTSTEDAGRHTHARDSTAYAGAGTDAGAYTHTHRHARDSTAYTGTDAGARGARVRHSTTSAEHAGDRMHARDSTASADADTDGGTRRHARDSTAYAGAGTGAGARSARARERNSAHVDTAAPPGGGGVPTHTPSDWTVDKVRSLLQASKAGRATDEPPPFPATAKAATKVHDVADDDDPDIGALQCVSDAVQLVEAQMVSTSGLIGHMKPKELYNLIKSVQDTDFDSWKSIVNAKCTDWESWTKSILAEPSILTKMLRIRQYFRLVDEELAMIMLLRVLQRICRDSKSRDIIRDFMEKDLQKTDLYGTQQKIKFFIRTIS